MSFISAKKDFVFEIFKKGLASVTSTPFLVKIKKIYKLQIDGEDEKYNKEAECEG